MVSEAGVVHEPAVDVAGGEKSKVAFGLGSKVAEVAEPGVHAKEVVVGVESGV